MSDTIKSVVTFTGIAIGGTQTQPHNLVLNGGHLKPDSVRFQFPSFEIVSATTTTLTIRNVSSVGGDCEVLCEAWHPIERMFGMSPDDGSLAQHLTPQPFAEGPDTGSGSTGGDGVVVFRPGGVATQNVVTTWADAVAQLALLQGTRWLEFDDSIVSPIVIPAGAFDMTGVTWSTIPDRFVEVHVPDGVTFTKLRSFDGRIHVTFTGTTAPVADFASPAPQIDTVTIGNGAHIGSTGAGPFFDVAATAEFDIGIDGSLLLLVNAVVNISAAVTVSIFARGADGIVVDATISGIVGSTLNLVTDNDSIVTLGESQPAFLGTLNVLNNTKDFTFPTAIVTGAALLAEASQVVRVDPTGGAFTITLPPAAGLRGQSITFKNVSASANVVTVAAGVGDNVDGAANVALSGSRFHARLTSDGVHQWMVTG